MTLALQPQTWCGSGLACPTAPQSMQVDWEAGHSGEDPAFGESGTNVGDARVDQRSGRTSQVPRRLELRIQTISEFLVVIAIGATEIFR